MRHTQVNGTKTNRTMGSLWRHVLKVKRRKSLELSFTSVGFLAKVPIGNLPNVLFIAA